LIDSIRNDSSKENITMDELLHYNNELRKLKKTLNEFEKFDKDFNEFLKSNNFNTLDQNSYKELFFSLQMQEKKYGNIFLCALRRVRCKTIRKSQLIQERALGGGRQVKSRVAFSCN